MSELKPCPFCGSEDIRFSNKTTSAGRKRHVAMFCNNCNCYGQRTILNMANDKKWLSSKEREHFGLSDAVDAWNNRPHENKIKVDAVREAKLACAYEDVGSDCFGGEIKVCLHDDLEEHAKQLENQND